MNFMGMGIVEVGVVLVIGFLVLGPTRSIDTARSAGKLIGELRRSFNEVMEAVNLERDHENGPSGRVAVERPKGASGPNSGSGLDDSASSDEKPQDPKTPEKNSGGPDSRGKDE